MLPVTVAGWLTGNGIDPIVFTAKKLGQLVRIIKSDTESVPDLFIEMLVYCMAIHSKSRKAIPFEDRDKLAHRLTENMDLEDCDEAEWYESVYHRGLINLKNFVRMEKEAETELMFWDDDHEMFLTDNGPDAGLTVLFVSFGEYTRRYFDDIFEDVDYQIPASLRMGLDDFVEFSLNLTRTFMQRQIAEEFAQHSSQFNQDLAKQYSLKIGVL